MPEKEKVICICRQAGCEFRLRKENDPQFVLADDSVIVIINAKRNGESRFRGNENVPETILNIIKSGGKNHAVSDMRIGDIRKQ